MLSEAIAHRARCPEEQITDPVTLSCELPCDPGTARIMRTNQDGSENIQEVLSDTFPDRLW